MYNGIGLPTARGSGTNGYVQKNLAHIKKTRTVRADLVAKPDPEIFRQPNLDIIAHQRKRKIEAKCFDLRRELERDRYKKDEIDRKVDRYRKRKLEELEKELEHEKIRRKDLQERLEEREKDREKNREKRIKLKKEEVKEEPPVPVEIKVEVKKEKVEQQDT